MSPRPWLHAEGGGGESPSFLGRAKKPEKVTPFIFIIIFFLSARLPRSQSQPAEVHGSYCLSSIARQTHWISQDKLSGHGNQDSIAAGTN